MSNSPGVSGDVVSVVRKELDMYSADRIGLADIALYSAGGRIVPSYTTQVNSKDWRVFEHNKDYSSLWSKILDFIPFLSSDQIVKSPAVVLQPGLELGNCYCFPGSRGNITVQLRTSSPVRAISLDHANKLVATTKSTPRQFRVLAYPTNLQETPYIIVEGEYNVNGEQIQTFPVKELYSNEPYRYLTLEIQSNYDTFDNGYTCIYRFRAHKESL